MAPYSRITSLPSQVKDNLPKHAQEIYKEAYNSAWDEYKQEKDRKGDDSRETVAHKVAWSAVKKSYSKKEGEWTKKATSKKKKTETKGAVYE